MHRVLILAPDDPLRSQLVEAVLRTANTEAHLVSSGVEMLGKVKFGLYAAVFADADLLDGGARSLVDAVRSAIVRPMIVIASNEKSEDLDPDWVTLVVRKPYDVLTVTGILLSAVLQVPPAIGGVADTTSAC